MLHTGCPINLETTGNGNSGIFKSSLDLHTTSDESVSHTKRKFPWGRLTFKRKKTLIAGENESQEVGITFPFYQSPFIKKFW